MRGHGGRYAENVRIPAGVERVVPCRLRRLQLLAEHQFVGPGCRRRSRGRAGTRRAGGVGTLRGRRRTGRSRCPTAPTASSMTAGPGDRSARCTPRRRSDLDRAARRAAAAGGREAVDAVQHARRRRAATRPATATGSAPRASPVEKRGWERRYHHVDLRRRSRRQDGPVVAAISTRCSTVTCGRGPHKIKMNPYDPEKHVWIIDDQLHVIYKFTYDGKLVMTLGTKGQRGRDGGKLFDRPTDIDWLPDGTFFISDGYGGTRVAKFDKDGKFLMDWGSRAEGSEESRAERVQHRPQHPDQQGPPALRRRSRAPADSGVRRERQVPRHVHDRRPLVAVRAPDHHRPVPLGRRRRDQPHRQVQT